MKKIAKITGVLLALMLAVLCMAVPSYAAGENYLTIEVYDDFAAVTGCNSYAKGVIDIPSTYNGVSVTNIGSSAFENCSMITQINVPSSVKEVGNNAFEGCYLLATVIFEGTDTKLDNAVFRNCSSLESVTLPSKLKDIPENTFYYCKSLTDVAIPSTVTEIGKNAFSNCSSLISVEIPASLKIIEDNAFAGCESVTEYKVASGNTVYNSDSGVLYGAYASDDSRKALIQYPNGKTQTSYTVASGTKIISNFAFGNNKYLSKITLPAGLEMIDDYGFYNCEKLSNITIPSSVTTLGSQSFGRCESLKSITIPSSVRNIESAFYMSAVESVIIENGLESIATRSFEKCNNLKSVSIPSSVKTIGFGAFLDCTALEKLVIPSTVTSINSGAFKGCSNIVLWVQRGSYAHDFAVENDIKFQINDVREIESVTVSKRPVKTSYYYKESLDTNGLELNVNYVDGTSEKVTSGFTVSPSTFNKTGSQIVTVTYEGFEAQFSVSVSYAWWQLLIRILLLGFLWY